VSKKNNYEWKWFQAFARHRMVPEGVTETASEHPAARCMHVPGDNRESRENRERSRRCDTALSFATDGEPDGQTMVTAAL
jgi:hypothetical protein